MINRHVVAVYGTLKKGLRNHYLLEGAKFLGEDTTTDKFIMLQIGGSYPAIIPHEKGNTVTVEIYEVNTETMMNLHELEGVPTVYFPERVTLKGGTEAFIFVWVAGAPKALAVVKPREDGVLSWDGPVKIVPVRLGRPNTKETVPA